MPMAAASKEGLTDGFYRLAWRHRWVDALGVVQHATRGTELLTASDVVSSCRHRFDEAVGGEFVVTFVGSEGEINCNVHGVELASWRPVMGELPRGSVETFWATDMDAASAKWRIYARMLQLFEEARSLRIVSRRPSREIMHRIHGLLFDPVTLDSDRGN